jgi:small subunit ribosomal protein S20
LANTKSAIKRIRSSEKRRLRNRQFRTQARTYVKRARAQIEAGELEEAEKSVAEAIRALDKAAEKGIIHRNNAARRKSRLMLHLNQAVKGTAT